MNGSFLAKKNRGGLVRPTQDVIKVCETTEMCLQRLLKVTNGSLPQSSFLPHAIGSAVLGEIGQEQIFISLSEHMYDSPSDCNHIFFLIKKIATSYLKIRMHYLAKHVSEDVSGANIRKDLSKLILFRHH